MTRRVVLVGGGHAHVHLLHHAARYPDSERELVLVSPGPEHHYSGMVPGYLAGQYRAEELTFDLEALVQAAGGHLVRGWATAVSLARRQVEMEGGGEPVSFDAVSLDVGSVPVGLELPGVREHAATVRPMSRAVELQDRIDARVARGVGPLGVAVVGGGAAGVEVALALDARIRAAGRSPRVVLVEAGPRLLPDFAPRFQARVRSILQEAGVELRTKARGVAVAPDRLHLEGGGELMVELVVWLAGAAPPPLLAASDLPRSEEGFFLVDGELRAAETHGSRPPAWGAGDCIALEGAPWMPRAGVYAVRQSPVLARNVLQPDRPLTYTPQRSFLALLNTADGRALLRWKGVVAHGRWAWRLKDWIDRRFMARYGGGGGSDPEGEAPA